MDGSQWPKTKSDFLVFSIKFMLGHEDYVDVFEEQIQPASSAKNLGVIFDACLFL